MPQRTGWSKAVLSHPKLLILDTETTDLDGYIVQLAVLRARDGETLFDTLLNPLAEIAPSAQRVHGITAEMVASAPTFAAIEPWLRELLAGRPVAIYNAEFDTGILYNELMRLAQVRNPPEGTRGWVDQWMGDIQWVDVMHPYSQWVDEPGRDGYRWQKLPGGDHTALGDCRAALDVLKRMADIQISIDPGDARIAGLEAQLAAVPAYAAYHFDAQLYHDLAEGPEPLDFAGWLAAGIRDQCQAAGVAFFMKQMGGVRDKRSDLEGLPEDLRIRQQPEDAGRQLDGCEWNEMPESVR